MVLSRRYEIEPIDPSEVPEYASDWILAQYFQVATLALIVFDARMYDHTFQLVYTSHGSLVTTMDKEVGDVHSHTPALLSLSCFR